MAASTGKADGAQRAEAARARRQIIILTAVGVLVACVAESPLRAGMDLKWQATQALKWAIVLGCHVLALRSAWRGGQASTY